MKIGIVIYFLKAGTITASHMEQSLLLELDKIDSNHEFIIFTWSKLTEENTRINKRLKYVSIPDYNTILNKLYRRGNGLIKRQIEFYLRKTTNPLEINEKLYCFKQDIYNVALIKNKIDLVYSMNPHGFPTSDIPYIANCFDCNVLLHPYSPAINTIDNPWIDSEISQEYFLRKATYITASTQALKNQLIRFYGLDENKIHINPLFVSKLDSVQTYFAADTTFKNSLPSEFLFYPARYMPEKNHILALLALKELKFNRNCNLNLVCVGHDRGNLSYLKRKTLEFGLEKNVFYYGTVPHADLEYLYKKAIALIFTTFNGPDNIPPIEAMAFGCPVIASNLEGSLEQFGDAALTFEKTNFLELANKIYELINNNALREKLIASGFNCVKNKTPEVYVQNLLKIADDFENVRRTWDRGYYHLYDNLDRC